jgi:alkylated DNA repair dioxygenase AlkB
MEPPASFRRIDLADGLFVLVGRVPDLIRLPPARFEELWSMHPTAQPTVVLKGERMLAPRWHQAYGRDYEFAGATSRAQPVPAILQPMLDWTRQVVEPRTNGILVNWYDAAFEHRIAQHRDSPIQRVPDCPIVTVSLGAERTFQMFVHKRPVPIRVGDGDVVVIPDATNKRFGHAVPHLDGDSGRRISVTLRSFEETASG